jgi:hypothetical protein
MIPKSGNWFSAKIMRNQNVIVMDFTAAIAINAVGTERRSRQC